tara:strand:+ start:730 stop:966 length:237 start_codon:yes stop_codon:yes gene_type:complete
MPDEKKKNCRYVNSVIKSKLDPINKGLVLEETKTKPYGYIKMLIEKLERGKDIMEAKIEVSKEYRFKKESKPLVVDKE